MHFVQGALSFDTLSGKNNFANRIAPHPFALKSCSNPQKTQQVFESAIKTNFWFRALLFVGDVISKADFWTFCLLVPDWVQPLDRSISLKFSLKTRLESTSFGTLIDFLVFLVQKLWSEINKQSNYLIMGLITLLISDLNFCTRNPSILIKVSKDSDFSLVSNKNLNEALASSGLGLGPEKNSFLLKIQQQIKKFQNPIGGLASPCLLSDADSSSSSRTIAASCTRRQQCMPVERVTLRLRCRLKNVSVSGLWRSPVRESMRTLFHICATAGYWWPSKISKVKMTKQFTINHFLLKI